MMESSKDKGSEAGDTEDIPSDFFDDFTTEEFMEGLSVIDSWDFNKEKNNPPADLHRDRQKADLRDLISEIKSRPTSRSSQDTFAKEKSPRKRSVSSSRLSDFIKPGSRRDPNKTIEAIRRDKEEKVKVFLAKHLEDDLRPPGTELDDYYNEGISAKSIEKSTLLVEEKIENRTRPSRKPRESPVRKRTSRRSPHWSPRKSPHRSPRRQRMTPKRTISTFRYSPHKTQRRSPLRRSSPRRSPQRRRSPWHHRSRSPRVYRKSRSPHKSRRSRSPLPLRRRELRRSRSRSIGNIIDNFIYSKSADNTYNPSNISYSDSHLQHQYTAPGVPPYMVPQEPIYSECYNSGYNYGGPPAVPMQVTQPTQMPIMNLDLAPTMPMGLVSNPVPSMVPAPQLPQSSPQSTNLPKHLMEYTNPEDGLAKLYAEGKISKEDYLKLAPNKGVNYTMDTQTRVKVLNRCNDLVTKLSKLLLPRRLVVNMKAIGPEQKTLLSKHCSPLKRQPHIDFNYTVPNSSMAQQRNKRLIDTIISTLGLEAVVTRTKSSSKNMKDAEVQTTKPYCDVCEIRENTSKCEASTSVDIEHFSSSIHTQVIEEELLSSKAVFNPSGSVGHGATMSIAHMTPAQLVSQLAARAKSLKQSDGEQSSQVNQFNRWNQPNSSYDYGGRGSGSASSQQYQNYYRY